MLKRAIERPLLVCAAIVVALVAAEGLARVGHRLARGEPFARASPVYSDGCCHVKPSGYVMIAGAIGDAISGHAR